MPFRTLGTVTARNVNGDTFTHPPETVLSDWELEPFVRDKIREGSEHYRNLYEVLTDREAHTYRVRATQTAPAHVLEGKVVVPPFDDYVGLHPTEIVERLRSGTAVQAQMARDYERAQGGMGREMIVSFVHATERQPWNGYDEMELRDILEKMEAIGADQRHDVVLYEQAHKDRPAIVEYDAEDVAAAA